MNINHNVILQEFGDIIGLTLSFDKNGRCPLLVDGQILISIAIRGEYWQFHSLLMEDKQYNNSDLFTFCLQLNIALAEDNAGALAYDPISKYLIYISSQSEPATGGELLEIVRSIISRRELILIKLKDFNPHII